MRQGQCYTPTGLLALDPRAFGGFFDVLERPAVDAREAVAVVTIRGPLDHHARRYGWGDSYEAIIERVAQALETRPKAVVLSVDSPGGLVSGMLDTSRTLRAMARTAEIPLLAFVDGASASAAYALTCAADRVFVTPTSIVGSIGVIDALLDVTGANEARGVKISLVTSGERKGDGDPNTPTSEDALAAVQKRVDELASEFFALVAEHRGISADSVRDLEAATVLGAEAVRIGLADEIATFDEVLALASADGPTAGAKGSDMDKEEEARKALKAIADDDDADDKARARARKALKAMDEEESKAEDDDEKKPESKKAKAEDEKPGAEDDDEKKPEAAALRALAEVHKLRAQIAAKEEEAERRELLASRPDFAPELLASLGKARMETVRDMVKTLPRTSPRHPAAAASATPTRGAGQGEGQVSDLPPKEAAAMAQAMGLTPMKIGVKREGPKLFLGAEVPAEDSK